MTADHRREELEAALVADAGRPLAAGEREDVALLAELLGDPATWAEPRAGLEGEIALAVAAERDAVPSVAGADTGRRRGGSRWLVASIAAAVVLVGAGGGALVVARQTPTPLFQGRLAATALAQGASGSVGVAKTPAGFRVHLDATHLPALAAGEYFQAWVADPAGTSVPIGTFSASDHRVTLWAGVSPATYTKLTVTIERADGVQASSGRVVLVGHLHHR